MRLLSLIAALAATAAAAFVIIFAMAFGVYALLEPHLGRAGAAGCLILAFALVLALTAFFASLQLRLPKPRRRQRDAEAQSLPERLIALVREKPYAAAGVAAAIGLLTTRNPRLIGAALRAFTEGWEGGGKKR